MKKVFIFIILIIIGIFAFFFYKSYMKEEKLTDILENVEEEFVINRLSIFGTHLNINGCIDKKLDSLELVLKNKKEEITLQSNIEVKDDETCFYTSKNNNDGIYLDDLKEGKFIMLIKSGEEYYTLKDETNSKKLEYYTVTREEKNNKIDIIFDKVESKNYIELDVLQSKLPDNVYDIAIDPGHGGKDSGASGKIDGKEYYEKDSTLEIAKLLKKELEKEGLKVKLTRDSDTNLSNYDEGGRAVIANEFNTKYSISIHLNSSTGTQKYGGVEVYVPNDVDLTLAKLLSKNIAYKFNYSKKQTDKLDDGIYFTYLDENDIKDANKKMEENDMEPYDIEEGAPYMFMIRELGGINTHAYVDGRNEYYGLNPYYNSNKTTEPYLIEMAYMNYESDLRKIINEPEIFASAIKNALCEYLNIS